jgi:hypothetical protein
MSNLCMIVWNLACGFAQTESQLIGFRLLAGIGGSAPMSVSLKFYQLQGPSDWVRSSDWRRCSWGLLATG